MSASTLDLNHALFSKTALGQQEIQSRALRLDPILRRLLILIDGKRSFQELSGFVVGHDLANMLRDLQAKGCIEATASSPLPAVAPAAALKAVQAVQSDSDDLASLPDAGTRTTKDVDMARHCMMNTVNTVFQQNTRLTLMEAIFACKTAEEARRVYPKWVETMKTSPIGAKRLPEFREKLFQVL